MVVVAMVVSVLAKAVVVGGVVGVVNTVAVWVAVLRDTEG